MFETMKDFFVSGFYFPGLSPLGAIMGIGLGILFGAVWFLAYWTPVLKKPRVWAVLTFSAFFTWIAIALIQIPLQRWTGQLLNLIWDQGTLIAWLPLAGIPQTLLSGLVQEAAKLAPVAWYRLRLDRDMEQKLGLAIGAVSGLGYGVFEAVWVHNLIFSAGFNLGMVESNGLIALAGFWERFFAIALHIAVGALSGYGLAKGRWWQFYLLAAFLHSLTNYGVILLQSGVLTVYTIEIYIAAMATLITAGVLWLRWRKAE